MTRHLFRSFSVRGPLSFAVVSAAQSPPTGQRAPSKDPAAPNPSVSAWAHTEAATQNSSAMVAFLAILPDGSWSEKLDVAARGSLQPTIAISEGRCSRSGTDAIVCETTRSARSGDGMSWTPTQPQPPTLIQLRGSQLFAGGWLFHRSDKNAAR